MSFSALKRKSLKMRLKFMKKIIDNESISPWAPEELAKFKEEFQNFRGGNKYLNFKDLIVFCPEIYKHTEGLIDINL